MHITKVIIFLSLIPFLNVLAGDIDILHYENSITISDTSNKIVAETKIKFLPGHLAGKIALNFKNLKVDSIKYTNQLLDFIHQNDLMEIDLTQLKDVPDTMTLIIGYSGSPTDGLIIKNNKYGRKSFFADNWPDRAHNWFPCRDILTDKATVSFNITAPNTFMVIANGKFLRRTNNLNNTSTTTYMESIPIPTYCMVFGAAEFDVVEDLNSRGIPITYWLFPEDYQDGINEFRRAAQMVDYYSTRFGNFPYEKLALVQSSTIFGGMENAGAIFFDENSIGTPRSIEVVVAHEIVHQWFGDYITESQWSHLWLSEGFAEYFGIQFFEHADGKAAFKKELKKELDLYLGRKSLHERSIIENQQDLMQLLNMNNYKKGAFVLHMLRALTGDETFWQGIATFCETYAGKNVSTSDFQNVMENTYGQKLDWFFKQWIFNPGIPYLDIEYSWHEKTKLLSIDILQTQTTPIMRFPLDLQFLVDGNQIKTVWIEKAQHTFNFPLSKKPLKINVDPDLKLLARVQVNNE